MTINEILEQLNKKFGNVQDASWFKSLEKTAHSKNITAADWNSLILKAATNASDVEALKTAVAQALTHFTMLDAPIELGTGDNAVQQRQNQESGVTEGYFSFTGKNPNATELDSELTGEILYGASGAYAASFGGKSAAIGKRAFSEGTTTIAKGAYSHAEGNNSVALGAASHAEGSETTAKANYSHAEGGSTVGGGAYSHAEGLNTIAGDEAAHAEGENTKADARAAHTEGIRNTVYAEGAHAEGMGNIIGEAGQPSDAPDTGLYAHVEGSYNYVRGDHAHAEGQNNVIGLGANYAHVSGNDNVAKHAGAHLMGKGLVSGRQNQTVVGRYNEYDDDAMFIVAAGEKYEPRNILVVRPDGTVEFEGKYYDYVVTDSLQFRNIGSLKGRILVKNVTFTKDDNGSIYKVSNDTSLLEFVNTSMELAISFTIEGNTNCKILGLNLPDYASNIEIKNFGSVEDCKLKGHWAGSFVNCTHVENCSAAYITGCKYVINCELISERDAVVQNCDYVSGIRIGDDPFGNYTNDNVVCRNCNFIANVDANGTYIDCTYVDPNTCKGFVKDEDVGKVQVLTNDGTFQTAELGGNSGGGKLYQHCVTLLIPGSDLEPNRPQVQVTFTVFSKSSEQFGGQNPVEFILNTLTFDNEEGYGDVLSPYVGYVHDSFDTLTTHPLISVNYWSTTLQFTYYVDSLGSKFVDCTFNDVTNVSDIVKEVV